jgi:hypothetical protein
MRNVQTLFLSGALVLGCMTPSPASGVAGEGSSGGDSASSITFRNRSRWDIHRINMSPVSQSTWGVDHLGSGILRAGQDFSLHNIPCNSYDLRLIDEDGDQCVLNNVNVCAENSGVTITNENLLRCEGWR